MTTQHNSSERIETIMQPQPSQVDVPPAGHRHHGHDHGGHGWLMWLMCLPMLILVGVIAVTRGLGGGGLLFAVGCLLMMGVMMRLMNHGTDGGPRQ